METTTTEVKKNASWNILGDNATVTFPDGKELTVDFMKVDATSSDIICFTE